MKRFGIVEVFRKRGDRFVNAAMVIWVGVFVASAFGLYLQPRLYLGKVRLEIMPNSRSFEVFPENSSQARYDSDTFMATETMVLTSNETLYRVIDELQLVKKWADAKTKADASMLLREKIEVVAHAGTTLVDIVVRHFDPQEAAALANGIAFAYRDRRNAIENSRSSAALDMLNAQLSLQSQKVEDSRVIMIELMEKYKIVDFADLESGIFSSLGEIPDTGTRALLLEARQSTLRAEIDVSNFMTLAERLTSSEGSNLLAAVLAQNSSLLPDQLQKQMDAIDALGARRAVLSSQGIDETAPEMVTLKAETEFYRSALEASANTIRASLTAEGERRRASLRNLKAIQDAHESDLITERKRYAQYAEAKRNYQRQRSIFDTMKHELLQEKLDLTMPGNPIAIHEVAEANSAAVSPDVPADLWAGFWMGFAVCIPGALLVIYIGHAFSPEIPSPDDDAEEPLEAIEVIPDPRTE